MGDMARIFDYLVACLPRKFGIGDVGEGDAHGGDTCGLAYLFRFDGTSWVEEQKMTASDAFAFDLFGSSVSVSGETAVVGALLEDCAAGDRCGAAYVFDLDQPCLFCGDGTCDPDEDSCSCAADCGAPPSSELPESTCTDGLDNDCDGLIDSDDPDCTEQPIPTITQWGMIFLALLLLATGKIVFRRTANPLSSMWPSTNTPECH